MIAGLGWSAPLWTLSALALAVAISVLLGHAVAVASSAVILAGAGDSSEAGGRPRTTAAVSPGARPSPPAHSRLAPPRSCSRGQPARREESAPTRDALTVVSSGVRLRVIAIDGFDARIFDELAGQRRSAGIDGDGSGDAGATRVAPGDAGDPARVWTTIATGQPPDVHGVQGLETRRVAGMQGSVAIAGPSPLGRALRGATDFVRLTRPAIASGTERRAKTFWEVAADAGLRTSVVNWWATWPAPAETGVVLSDRATLRLERGGALDAEIAPASLYEPLRQRWPDIKAAATARADGALAYAGDDTTRALLRRSAELDAIQLGLLSEVAAPGTDLSVVYLPGLDIAQHALLGSDQTGLAASTLAARLDAREGLLLGARSVARAVPDAGCRRARHRRHRTRTRRRAWRGTPLGTRRGRAAARRQRERRHRRRAHGVVRARDSHRPGPAERSAAGALRPAVHRPVSRAPGRDVWPAVGRARRRAQDSRSIRR